jgi:DNA-binding SARP family transcriptional activator
MVALEPAKLMQETVQRITEPLSQMQQYHTELARKLMSSAVLSSDYFKAINSLDNLSTLATRSLSNLLPSLYIASTLEESEKISKEALTHPLIKRLDKLPTGIEK